MPVLGTGPDVAAARADREENHDPGGEVNDGLDGSDAIREMPTRAYPCRTVLMATACLWALFGVVVLPLLR